MFLQGKRILFFSAHLFGYQNDIRLAMESVGAIVDYYDERYNPQIQISAESGTKRSNFRQKDKTKRSKKRLHTTLIKPEQKVNEDLCSGFIVS